MKLAALLAGAAVLLAPDHARASGFATFFANITAEGEVAVSSGVNTAARTDVGTYVVRFNRQVNRSCGYVSSLRGSSGYSVINLRVGTAHSFVVKTFGASGAAADRAFNVIVTCAP